MTAIRQRTEWVLEPETELRCESCEGEVLTLRLLEGNAEIFGVEMAPNKEYHFSDENFAVYTWYGCKLEANTNSNSPSSVNMSMSSAYKADTTPNVAYVNTHSQLEARRDVALANQEYGPRVSVFS
jgi:polyribonucleotide 5'-hydroxyl-kinase